MGIRLGVACVAAGIVAACGPSPRTGSGGDVGDPLCEGPAAKQPRPLPITNGSPGPTAFTIDEGQQLAVGALLLQEFGGFDNGCTGTLIGPDTVLTAAHCVWSHWSGQLAPRQVRFGIGPDMDSPLRVFLVASVHVHPSYPTHNDDARYDVAILRLAEDAPREVPGLVPLQMNRDPLPQALVGRQVQTVGYGATDPDDMSNTRRWWTTEVVTEVTGFDVTVDGQGRSAVCFGDSGGPLLLQFDDGTVRVAGVLSWGDPTCLDEDHFGRVDPHVGWIEQEDVAGAVPTDGCGTVPAEGECAGSMLRACDGERIVHTDCALIGERCGASGAGFACVPDPCEGLDFAGTCDGAVAKWCEDGEVRTFDCGRCGWSCGFVSDALGSYCVP